jgi:hypothetical protein
LPVYRGTLTVPGVMRTGAAVSVTPSPVSGEYVFLGLEPNAVLGLLAGQSLSFPGRVGSGKMTQDSLTISLTNENLTFDGQRE